MAALAATRVEAAFPGWEGRNGGNTGSPPGGEMVLRECRPVLETAGISPDKETVLIFCHLAAYDETAATFRHHSPYFGSWSQANGLCFAADWAAQYLAHLTRKKPMLHDGECGRMSLAKHMTIFLGGIAHELGHAFALPHCGERWEMSRPWHFAPGRGQSHLSRGAAAGGLGLVSHHGQRNAPGGEPAYSVDIKETQTLELIVEKAGRQNDNNWALWLDPMQGR